MKISYVSNARIPTEKAHGYAICKMCEEFANLENEVQLIVPTRRNSIDGDLFAYYGLEKNFKVKKVKLFDFISSERFFFGKGEILQRFFFLFKLLFIAIDKDSVIYTRNPEIAWLFKKKGHVVYYESHLWPKSKKKMYSFFLKNVDRIVCISFGIANKHKENGLKDVMIAPSGVDLDDFVTQKDKKELRQELDLRSDKKIITYVGKFKTMGQAKGVESLIAIFKEVMIQEPEAFLLLVGASREEQTWLSNLFLSLGISDKNYKVVLHQPREKIAAFLQSSDLLVMNYPGTEHYAYFMSPIKLFEYMASGTPIITSDLPTIREIVQDADVFFFETENMQDLKEKMLHAIGDEEACHKRSSNALEKVQGYSWEKRAEKIMSTICK